MCKLFIALPRDVANGVISLSLISCASAANSRSMSTRRALALDRATTRPLGLDITAAAAGIIRVATANMVLGIHVVSVERGHDRRCQTLVPFCGAGRDARLAARPRPCDPVPPGAAHSKRKLGMLVSVCCTI